MLFVTLILFPLTFLYIFIRACQEERKMRMRATPAVQSTGAVICREAIRAVSLWFPSKVP